MSSKWCDKHNCYFATDDHCYFCLVEKANKVEALESRIEKLREVLDEIATDGSIFGNNEDHEYLRIMADKALKADDKARGVTRIS